MSVIGDSPTDVDDGGPGDTSYAIGMAPGARLAALTSAVQGASRLDADGASVELRESFLFDFAGPLHMMGASAISFTNVSIAGPANPAFVLEDSSEAAVAGGTLPSYTVTAGALFTYSTFAAVEVQDTSSKPLQGAEWSFETAAGVIAGSSGLGGMDGYTGVGKDATTVPQWVALPHLVDEGGVRSTPTVLARASYGEWSETRVVATNTSQWVRFTAAPGGLQFLDGSHEAMLDNMGHDMMMDGNMSGGSMGGMEMEGPMMTQGPGAAWGDFDGDGVVDVVVSAGFETDSMMLMEEGMAPEDAPAPILFLGNGDGTFVHSMTAGLDAAVGAMGISAADFDGDGDLDLFVGRYGEVGMIEHNMATMEVEVMPGHGLPSFLYENDGHGVFYDVTASVGLSGLARHTVGGVWSDFDRDGCLDLYVVNMGEFVMSMDGMMDHMSTGMGGMGSMEEMYAMSYFRNESNVLYRNQCDGTFEDVTAHAGVGGTPAPVGEYQMLVEDPASSYWVGQVAGRSLEGSGVSYTALWIDADEDGWPDLLVANDFGVSPLYRNNGDGTFTLWTAEAGLDKVGSAMGYAVADFNRDGHLDFFQTNFEEDFLWLSQGDGTFHDAARAWGVWDMSVGWGAAAVDVNLDGFPDIAMSVGYMSMGEKVSTGDVLFLNQRGERFIDVSAPSGFDNPGPGISATVADVDLDGRPDIFVGHTDNMNSLYLNRDAGRGLRLDLRGVSSNSFGLGATVTATVGGKPFRATVLPGGEYGSSSEPSLWIGLGAAASARAVTVHWPSGVVQALGDLRAGDRVTVHEGARVTVDAGPDAEVRSDEPVTLSATLGGDTLVSATYRWVLHGPLGDLVQPGMEASFVPTTPGVWALEFQVFDRFGSLSGSDFCVMRVADTTAPVAYAAPVPSVKTGVPAQFNASASTDNDPAFESRGAYTWTFTNGGDRVTAQGPMPKVVLPRPGTWQGVLEVTDPAGNTASYSFQTVASGPAGARVTADMVTATVATIAAFLVLAGLVARRLWFSDPRAATAAPAPEDEAADPEHGAHTEEFLEAAALALRDPASLRFSSSDGDDFSGEE
jgi:hypothetical protein